MRNPKWAGCVLIPINTHHSGFQGEKHETTMAESDLGLSDGHEHLVVEYLRSGRLQRSQCIKTVESTFEELMESRLNDDTFTYDEVRQMLVALCGAVKADVGAELINNHHTSALLLRQLLQQADKWFLQMTADISAIENRELLDEMAKFEENRLSSSSKPKFSPSHKFLEPLNTSGGDSLLRNEIKRLEEENHKLKERLTAVQTKATSALTEKDKLKSDLVAASSTTSGDSAVSVGGSDSAEELASLQAKIEELQTKLSESKTQGSNSLKDDLAQTAQSLLKVTAELEKTKQELEEKFSATAQYQNMRKMLSSKNEQIKELRTKLKKYESGVH